MKTASKAVKKHIGRSLEYKAEHCHIAVEAGKEGASKVEIALRCGVSRKTLDYWREKLPEFDDAMDHAEMHAQVWWEHRGRDFVTGNVEKASAVAFIFQMKNRFSSDYRDRHEHTGANGGAIALSLSKDDAAL